MQHPFKGLNHMLKCTTDFVICANWQKESVLETQFYHFDPTSKGQNCPKCFLKYAQIILLEMVLFPTQDIEIFYYWCLNSKLFMVNFVHPWHYLPAEWNQRWGSEQNTGWTFLLRAFLHKTSIVKIHSKEIDAKEVVIVNLSYNEL